MSTLVNLFGCSGGDSGCARMVHKLEVNDRIEYGVFVGYYGDDEEDEIESGIEVTSNVSEGFDSYLHDGGIDEVLEEKEEDKLRESFNEISNNTGYCSIAETTKLSCIVGLSPSNIDIENLLKLNNNKDQVDFDTFMKWSTTITHPEDHSDYLVNFFRKYDINNTGFISRKQFKWLMDLNGDHLSNDQIEEILTKLNINEDTFRYNDLISKLINAEAINKPMLQDTADVSVNKHDDKKFVSKVSNSIRKLVENEDYLPTIDFLEKLKETYGNDLTSDKLLTKFKSENEEISEEACKVLLDFYTQWIQNKGLVNRDIVRRLLIVWKGKFDHVSAESWITSICGTDLQINIEKVLKTMEETRDSKVKNVEIN